MRILKERIINVAPKGATTTTATAAIAASTAAAAAVEVAAATKALSPVADAYHNKKPTSDREAADKNVGDVVPSLDDDNILNDVDANFLSNVQYMPSTEPLNGFVPEMTSFLGGGDRLITIASGERFLCYINARECADECTIFDFRASVSSIIVAHNYRFFIICIDHKRRGAMIIIKDSSTFDTIVSFPARVLAQQMCISLNNRVLLLFSARPDSLSAFMCTYSIMEGTMIAEAKIVSSIPTRHWEISFCPADEDVICLLADDHVNLMRSTSHLISVFSTHRIENVTCHTWADDVTQAFGTRDGRIILYRETVPLETIDLKQLHSQLISEVEDSPTAAVVKMFSCEFGMLVSVEAGVIFFFPPNESVRNKGDEKGSSGTVLDENKNILRWKNSKAIVLNSLMQTQRCLCLHLDESGGNILYGHAGGIYICNMSYSETVCKEGMRPIVLRHAAPIAHISVDVNSNFVASADTSNVVLVTSVYTRKVLSGGVIAALIALAILPGGHKILIATRTELAVYAVLHQNLQKVARIEGCGTGFQAMTADPLNKRIAVLRKTRLLIFRTDSLDKALESNCGTKQDILKLRWSLDGTLIGILTTRDTVCLIQADSGKILWIAEFKLRFFVDVSIVDASHVYVMGNKFMMSRLDGGREAETFPVHHEAINFKEQSTVLISTKSLNFIGVSTGAIIRVDSDNFENNVLLNCRQKSSITTITQNYGTDQLYVGFEDGQVICCNINDSDAISLTSNTPSAAHLAVGEISDAARDGRGVQPSQDFVLCPVEEIVRYKTIVCELNAERNMIREQGQQILSEYRQRKEGEICQLNEQLERLALEMRKQMKKADEKFETIEAAKEEVVKQMKVVMRDEVRAQKQQYEKMLNDQIKMSLEKEEKQRLASEEMMLNYEKRIADMEHAAKKLKAEWNHQSHNLQEHIQKYSNRLKQKELQLEKAYADRRAIDELHTDALKAAHAEHAQEHRDQVEAIKQLKAQILRLKEENQTLSDNFEEFREKFQVTNDELEDCRVQLETKARIMSEEATKSFELDRRLDIKKNELGLMKQKFKMLQADVDQEKAARQIAQRRLGEFDTLVSEMADHMYDARRLEQSMLGLLAFFNATKVPALNQASLMVALRQNQIPAIGSTPVTTVATRSRASRRSSGKRDASAANSATSSWQIKSRDKLN